MSRITTTVAIFLLATAAYGQAKEDAGDGKQLNKQTMELKDYLPEIHGTIRGKYEFQTETNESRFEVRMPVSVFREMYILSLLIRRKSTCPTKAPSRCSMRIPVCFLSKT